ncbi:hypothetical protein V5O48_010506 [Marasmius crinis-equi]|uniref:Uncharacterized protein n=1 Tax=Marasmius crinis-equi TaxID=585013 RepID=A0ABR3F886_9AGAR
MIPNPFKHERGKTNRIVLLTAAALSPVMDANRFKDFKNYLHRRAKVYLIDTTKPHTEQDPEAWRGLVNDVATEFSEIHACENTWPVIMLYNGRAYHKELVARRSAVGKESRRGTNAKECNLGKSPTAGRPLNKKRKILYVGLDPRTFNGEATVTKSGPVAGAQRKEMEKSLSPGLTSIQTVHIPDTDSDEDVSIAEMEKANDIGPQSNTNPQPRSLRYSPLPPHLTVRKRKFNRSDRENIHVASSAVGHATGREYQRWDVHLEVGGSNGLPPPVAGLLEPFPLNYAVSAERYAIVAALLAYGAKTVFDEKDVTEALTL